jgi:hypothetical protein
MTPLAMSGEHQCVTVGLRRRVRSGNDLTGVIDLSAHLLGASGTAGRWQRGGEEAPSGAPAAGGDISLFMVGHAVPESARKEVVEWLKAEFALARC